jgi:hypothetical protein
MALRIKHQTSDSSWTTPAAGTIRVKSNGEWKVATSVKVKQGESWVDSGYVAYPNAPTSFRVTSGGNGDTKAVTFAWTAPAAGATVTGYRLKIYDSNNNLLETQPADTAAGTTTRSYTFTGAAGSVYYARIFTLGSAGESLTSGTTQLDATRTRLRITIGAASSTTDTSDWGSNVSFTPGYLGQSRWPGQDYNDFTYHGSKAFDGDVNTYWSGQSWAYNGGSDWISFQLGNNLTPRLRVVELSSLAFGNGPGTITVDELFFPNWSYTNYAWGGASAFGFQIIPCNFELAAGQTRVFRLWYTNLGANPTPYGTYRVLTREVSGVYQLWVTSSTTTAATANTIAAVA